MFLYTALQWRQLQLLEMVFHVGGMFNRDLFGKQLSIWLSNSICPTPDTSSPLILFSQQLSSSQPYCSNKKKKTADPNFLQPPGCLERANTRTVYSQRCWCESSLHPPSHTVPSPCSVALLFPVSAASAWNTLHVQKNIFKWKVAPGFVWFADSALDTNGADWPWPIRIGIHPSPLVLIINYNTIMILHGIFWLFRKSPVLQLDRRSWCQQSLNIWLFMLSHGQLARYPSM